MGILSTVRSIIGEALTGFVEEKVEKQKEIVVRKIEEKRDKFRVPKFADTELSAPEPSFQVPAVQQAETKTVKFETPFKGTDRGLGIGASFRRAEEVTDVFPSVILSEEEQLSRTGQIMLDQIRLQDELVTNKLNQERIAEMTPFEKKILPTIEAVEKKFGRTVQQAGVGLVSGLTGQTIDVYGSPEGVIELFGRSGGTLGGFLLGLKGVGALVPSSTIAGGVGRLVKSPKTVGVLSSLLKGGVDFSLLGQAQSFVNNESFVEHLKTLPVDFAAGVGFGVMGTGIGKLPKTLQIPAEAAIWSGIAKAQGASTEEAVIQGVLMGGLRGMNLSPAKSQAEKVMRRAEKVLGVKRTAGEREINRVYYDKLEQVEPNSIEHFNLEASRMTLNNPGVLNNMMQSFKENRLVFYEGGIKGGKRPGIEKAAPLPDVTTRILEEVKGRKEVSKQFIQDLTNQPHIKQAERDLIRNTLDEFKAGDINVQEFESKVRMSLLPLEQLDHAGAIGETLYENITLPNELRGKVQDYRENVYQSPIPTSAGDTHFGRGASVPRYFAHTRIEDVANTDIRRVIELQSDLFQKGRLEHQIKQGLIDREVTQELQQEFEQKRDQLSPYRNIWYERIIREEIKRANEDNKKTVLFPTGETIMKIEQLGAQDVWSIGDREGILSVDDLKVGREIERMQVVDAQGQRDSWIITEVLEDGKFKALSQLTAENTYEIYNEYKDENGELDLSDVSFSKMDLAIIDPYTEQFDISGKVDTSNPIYNFYEKQVQKYLKREYGDAMNRITDPQGVEWYSVDIKGLPKETLQRPTFAFLRGPEGELGTQKVFKLLDENSPEPVRKIESEIFAELNTAMAGERIATEEGVVGIKSTFPDWIPSDLRSKKDFDSLMDNLLADKPITKTKEKQLMGVIQERINNRLIQENVPVRVEGLAEVGGELKIRGLSLSVEARAVEKGLVKQFAGLPQYLTKNMKEQANRALELTRRDYDTALEIAMGKENPPKGLLPESVFKAVEIKARKDNDVETIRRLATTSGLSEEATIMGQRIRALAETDPLSPVTKIKEVVREREKTSKKKLKGKSPKKIKTEMKENLKKRIKKAAPTKTEWEKFIDEIIC